MNDFIAIGDQMQSEASRLAEWALGLWQDPKSKVGREMPYEVRMSIVGVQSAIDQWTVARSDPSSRTQPTETP